MFTGLIEQVSINHRSRLRHSHSLNVTVSHAGFRRPLRTGDSVAVNGVCLTAVACTATTFTAEPCRKPSGTRIFPLGRRGRR